MRSIDLSYEWQVIQDVHELGEFAAVFSDDWDPAHFDAKHATLSEWESIPHLTHLQLLYSDTPYWGRSLRHFNEHPWWYRREFELGSPIARGCGAVLTFSNADYFARVWVNGTLVGSHEGYFAPFSFEVGNLLKQGANTVVAEVSSPWDAPPDSGWTENRFWSVERNLIKGTYEHGDTFVQRDVNPIGLFGQVHLELHAGVVISPNPAIKADLSDEDRIAVVTVAIVAEAIADLPGCAVELHVRDLSSAKTVGHSKVALDITSGTSNIELITQLTDPQLWHSWDRGPQPLYLATVTVRPPQPAATRDPSPDDTYLARAAASFGIRTIELIRDDQQMVYRINGQRIFLRGTSYFPDTYISKMSPQRYRRDLEAIRRAGCNAVRVHVHVEHDSFYSICDELGLLVIQDSDLNWNHRATDEFRDRAVRVFSDMIRLLQNHPSIISWVGINEPAGGKDGDLFSRVLGPALLAAAREIDPRRPIILGSGARHDANSGDSHNYAGSLDGHETIYLTLHDSDERLNTEFGFDAPACEESLRQEPALVGRLAAIIDQIPSLQLYQYRLLKYGIENYRIKKYAPCGGYFQFMWIDLSPQSFYGANDYWGVPKEGIRAFRESGQPVGVFLEHTEIPIALWVVNDTLKALGQCRLVWSVTSGDGTVVSEGSESTSVGPDATICVTSFQPEIDASQLHEVDLVLLDGGGAQLAHNHYYDPFHHPPHPAGHPHRVSNELGMRLYNA